MLLKYAFHLLTKNVALLPGQKTILYNILNHSKDNDKDNYSEINELLKQNFRTTILHVAAVKGLEQIVEVAYTIECQDALELTDSYQRTPLHIAVIYNRYNIVKLLISKEADVDAADENGLTPLYKAVIQNNYKMAQLLINHGANVNAKTEKTTGHTPLHFAAAHPDSNLVALLIKHGATTNSLNSLGNSPIYYALSNGNFEAALMLYKAGAVVNITNNCQKTPFDDLDCISKFNKIFQEVIEIMNSKNPGIDFTSLKELYNYFIQPKFINLVYDIQSFDKNSDTSFVFTGGKAWGSIHQLIDLLGDPAQTLRDEIQKFSEGQAAYFFNMLLQDLPDQFFREQCQHALSTSKKLQQQVEEDIAHYESSLPPLSDNNDNIDTTIELDALNCSGEDGSNPDEL